MVCIWFYPHDQCDLNEQSGIIHILLYMKWNTVCDSVMENSVLTYSKAYLL